MPNLRMAVHLAKRGKSDIHEENKCLACSWLSISQKRAKVKEVFRISDLLLAWEVLIKGVI
ncbi:hypothetical protein FRX31_023067 [Thalictrum thalictroides]|uniref:Uncharacterized protein n=1 Tax=Thalictrum thalictroides TaxID=46969 RepID=A0A7J6VQI7_THATH|nr:hypothetical protein FRX31_023067 [Thalictrum thalictroides]